MGHTLRVQLWGGQEYFGHFDFADDSIFRLKVPAHDHPGQTATSLTFDRAQVQIVMKLSKGDPDLETYSRVGTAVGAVAGATALGLAVHHSAWPAGVFFGGLGGAGVGMVAGSTVALIVHGSRHHRTVIYESQQRDVPRPPDSKN